MTDDALPRILCVDDEPRVLEGLQRLLSDEFDLVACDSGAAALDRLALDDGFAAVLSDMRMPSMNGAVLLARVRARHPAIVRMLLTGHSEIDAAAAAVNEGGIFRFLIKPCGRPALAAALHDAVRQHALARAERELLDRTVAGIVALLSEVVGLSHPEAHAHALRVRSVVSHLVDQLMLDDRWLFEAAALLEPVGTLVMHGDITASDLSRVRSSTSRLLGGIPRIDTIAKIVECASAGLAGGRPTTVVEHGAALLRIGNAVATGLRTLDVAGAIRLARGRLDGWDLEQLPLVAGMSPPVVQSHRRSVRLRELEPGMTLAQDVRTAAGLIVVSNGVTLTRVQVERVRQFAERAGISEPIAVSVN